VDQQGQLHLFIGTLPHLYYPLGTSDGVVWEHQSNFLNRWNQDKEFVKKFRKFSLPLCHRGAEEIVRATLQIPSTVSLTDAHVRQSAVCACLTPLRQTIGSCFATAPAILAQRHHLDLFVDDLYELLTTGRLRRVVEGTQYTVPFFAFKNTTDNNALLKAWEYTLASFSDIKMEFSRWNLSWSMGLHPNEKGGIGEALFEALNGKLQETNKKIEEFHKAVIEAFDKVKTAENLLKQASTEADVRRWRAEEQAQLYHLRSCEEIRDEFQRKAKAYAESLPFLVHQFTSRFQEYFQEIYDPEMLNSFTGPYEDRMAGFRLVYKHGRSDSSLWTLVYNPQQFVKVLVEFFTIIEPYVAAACEPEEEKKIVEEMTTVVIQHVQSDRFLHAAMERAAAKGREPWAYLSGGTMDQLIPIYFRSSSPPVKESREIIDELDLFVFLLDTLKGLSPKITEPFLKDPSRGILIESPTHAFSLLPGAEFFRNGWVDEGFTYTWIRDLFLIPGKAFFQEMQFSREEQRELMKRLSIYGDTAPSASVETFGNLCPQVPKNDLAAFLYRTVPLIPADQCKAVLQKLLSPWTDKIVMPPSLPDFISSEEIQLLAKAQIKANIDPHMAVAARAKELKLAPTACLFADTNWPQGYFAFVVHPLTLALEVWKSDRTGCRAFPIPLVKSWLGKGKDFTWALFIKSVRDSSAGGNALEGRA
ncbi:MAG: hypothetical protein ACRENF_00890, partial [Thermodesulfobacteriota bacterium]